MQSSSQSPIPTSPDALPVTQTTVQRTEGENITFHDLAHPNSPGGLPTVSVTTKGSWLPWGSLSSLLSAFYRQYPTHHAHEKAVISMTSFEFGTKYTLYFQRFV